MDKLALVKLILAEDKTLQAQSSSESFLELEKPYAFRTVTMIYTGRLKGINQQEFLVDEAAWIPDTERWKDFVDNGAVKECEPYSKPIIINRGAILDVTEIPSVLRKQK